MSLFPKGISSTYDSLYRLRSIKPNITVIRLYVYDSVITFSKGLHHNAA